MHRTVPTASFSEDLGILTQGSCLILSRSPCGCEGDTCSFCVVLTRTSTKGSSSPHVSLSAVQL